MPIYKRCPTCGKRLAVGQTCPCVKARYKNYDSHRDKNESAFYSSAEWSALRKQAIARFKGIDIYSLYTNNIIETGFIVHHVIPVPDDWGRRLDINNLIYLTESNHRKIHNAMKTEKEKVIKLLFYLVRKFETEGHGGGEKSF